MPKVKYEPEQDELAEDEYAEDEYDDDEDDEGFNLAGKLAPPRTYPISCQSIYNEIQDGEISLEAEYQRDVVWNNEKQSRLIDSVFRDYFVPPVLFAVHEIEGEVKKVCIDGKQRLTSIQRFMDGYIPVKMNGKSWYYQRKGNQTSRRLVPEGYRKQFAAKQLLCVHFDDLTEASERDIFQRVQLGMALNEAEKQKAIASPTGNWIRKLVSKYFEGDEGIMQHLPINLKRSKDYQCCAQFVYMALALPRFDMPATAKLAKFLHEQEERSKPFKSAVEKAIKALFELAKVKQHTETIGAHPIAPVELVHICLLCLMLHGRSSQVMAKKIHEMREYVRDRHIDVRANSRVAKTFAEFLQTLQAPGLPGPEADWQTNGKATVAVKPGRKRKVVEEEEEMVISSDEDMPLAKSASIRAKPKAKARA